MIINHSPSDLKIETSQHPSPKQANHANISAYCTLQDPNSQNYTNKGKYS
jgi:hypothetical protein